MRLLNTADSSQTWRGGTNDAPERATKVANGDAGGGKPNARIGGPTGEGRVQRSGGAGRPAAMRRSARKCRRWDDWFSETPAGEPEISRRFIVLPLSIAAAPGDGHACLEPSQVSRYRSVPRTIIHQAPRSLVLRRHSPMPVVICRQLDAIRPFSSSTSSKTVLLLINRRWPSDRFRLARCGRPATPLQARSVARFRSKIGANSRYHPCRVA
jgi:hypothetical protein